MIFNEENKKTSILSLKIPQSKRDSGLTDNINRPLNEAFVPYFYPSAPRQS